VATGDNAILRLFDEADKLTCAVTAAVSAGHFVAPSGNFQAGPLLDVSTPSAPLSGGNLIQVAHCGAGLKALGVAAWDCAASGDVLSVYGGGVVPVVSSGAIAAGAEVESNATGVAIARATGIALGLAVSAAANNIVYVRLYS
jgi:hypothetical protein